MIVRGLVHVFIGVLLAALGALRLYAYGEGDWIGWTQILVGGVGVGAIIAVLLFARNGWSR